MTLHPNPLRTAVAVVIENGQVLVVRGGKRPEEWCIPGGKIDPGETPEDAAKREALEEAGVIVTLDPVPLYIGPPGDGPWETAAYLALSFQGKPRPDNEIVEVGWVPPSVLVNPDHRFSSYYTKVFTSMRAFFALVNSTRLMSK